MGNLPVSRPPKTLVCRNLFLGLAEGTFMSSSTAHRISIDRADYKSALLYFRRNVVYGEKKKPSAFVLGEASLSRGFGVE